MAYDQYGDEIKKAEKRIECIQRFIIELEQNEAYVFASAARDELAREEKELEKLKSLQWSS